jgi:hypothetical protein
MSISSEAQALFDHARQSLPRWLTGATNSAREWLYGFTAVFDEIRVQGQDWIDITYLENAVGPELDQHARDRGTTRRAGESDGTLRERLRQISDAVTEPALLSGVDAILDGAGHLAIFETSTWVTTGWQSIYRVYDTIASGGYQTSVKFSTISDATHPPTLVETINPDTNIVTMTIHYSAGVTTRLDIDQLIVNNSSLAYCVQLDPSGATTLSAGDAITEKNFYLSSIVSLRRDRGHCHANGSCRAFMNRGYRMTNVARPMSYIVILPYPTNQATANAIAEYLRQYGPGGYQYYVERRLNP